MSKGLDYLGNTIEKGDFCAMGVRSGNSGAIQKVEIIDIDLSRNYGSIKVKGTNSTRAGWTFGNRLIKLN